MSVRQQRCVVKEPCRHRIREIGKKTGMHERAAHFERFLTNRGECINLATDPAFKEIHLRIGQGFDIHRLVPGRKLILAGEEIDFPLGLDGHSDADVLAHAIIDALLGAAGLGDIGSHFPDTDPAYLDASSMALLEIVSRAVEEMGYRIVNIDCTVFAEEPRIGPYRGDMVGNIATATGLECEQVNLKAKTAEKLGTIGTGEAIAAAAVVLLEHKTQEP
jgi:2-C-methyl-D-erythritol 2,4-cyclodiphosphate synthase